MNGVWLMVLLEDLPVALLFLGDPIRLQSYFYTMAGCTTFMHLPVLQQSCWVDVNLMVAIANCFLDNDDALLS